jgi:signal transduction histidine kinase/ActR/RegA family two-component response regulator
MDERVLVLAPRGRDAEVAAKVIGGIGACQVCTDLDGLSAALAEGAGAAVITEEALAEAKLDTLTAWLEAQPKWSDFPFIILVTKQRGPRSSAAAERLASMGNVVLLERPINAETLRSAAQSALRARRRQYQARSELLARTQAEDDLRALNESLESRIAARTAELSRANERLTHEILERERAQSALLQSQKMEAVGQLTGGIAHDFNNLLTAILGNVEMIARRSTDERVQRMAGYAREAVQRASKLTGQLLAFSRSQQLDLRPVEVDRLIDGMEDLLQRSLESMVEIRTELKAGHATAVADANQLELAILNLAINSRDAMPNGGVLTIATRVANAWEEDLRPGRYVVVAVSDTGTGIPPQLLSKVFDPFFTTKSVGKGTGLGLSQVYGIAKQSGGIARARSQPGAGTTIEIWLPVAGAAEGLEPVVAASEIARGSGERVLVIDDDFDVRRFLVQCLEGLGYAVTEAEHGQAGLERLEEARPDLLIVDFAMPGLSGTEVAALARKKRPDLPVMLVTGYADMRAVEKVFDGDAILRKPFKVDDLTAAIQRTLKAGRVPETCG